MNTEKSKACILNYFFSRTMVKSCISNKCSDLYLHVIRRYIIDPEQKTNAELISEVYQILKRDYRNEYFYKNTLLNKLLLGVYSLNTTSALTELPIDKAKADFVLINGKAVVYEIKTELDNFERLKKQIEEYYKAFDHVSVITCMNKVPELLHLLESIDKPVGVYVLQKNCCIKEIKKPLAYEKLLNADTIYKMLRKKEVEYILKKHNFKLPQVSDFEYYSECRKQFGSIPIQDIYTDFLWQLKKRSIVIEDDFLNVPYELKWLAYFMQLSQNDYDKLKLFLSQQYGGG